MDGWATVLNSCHDWPRARIEMTMAVSSLIFSRAYATWTQSE